MSMSEVLNPVESERIIRTLGNRIAECIPVVSRAEDAMVTAKRELEIAEAHALLAAEGTVAEREAQVRLAVQSERATHDVAYIAFRDAERRLRALRDQLSAAQSINSSIRAMYGAERG